MEELKNKSPENSDNKKSGGDLMKPIILVLVALLILWAVWVVLGFLTGSYDTPTPETKPRAVASKNDGTDKNAPPKPSPETSSEHSPKTSPKLAPKLSPKSSNDQHKTTGEQTDRTPKGLLAPQNESQPAQRPKKTEGKEAPQKKALEKKSTSLAARSTFRGIRGPGFVEAIIKPLDHELNERFWGWRANNIIRIADNTKNFQLGVLEVTRQTTVVLAKNISRTNGQKAPVPELEAAANAFKAEPAKWWFPSAESKYQEGLDKLRSYQEMLQRREARFNIRAGNLALLLKAYEGILDSCSASLVKDMGTLSVFKADDYLYHTQGVAQTMATILEAAEKDFHETIASVQGLKAIQQAIASLHHAADIEPLLVLEGDSGSLMANHRANMAAPIRHARSAISVLAAALTGDIM